MKSATTEAETSTPSTGTVLFSESFEDSNYLSRGWYDGTYFDLDRNESAIGAQSARFLFGQGATSWTGSKGAMRKKFTATDSLYISYYIKFSSTWRGSQKAYHPHMINILSDTDTNENMWSPLANNYLNTYLEFLSDVGSPYAIRPVLALQDQKNVNTSNGTLPNNLVSITENRSVNYCNTPVPSGVLGTCYADMPYYSANTWKNSTYALSSNTWHKVEVYLKMNTISSGKGQSNGIMQEWIDGVKVIDKNNVLYRTNENPTMKWSQFVIAPYIGDGSPVAQTFWLDELTVSTSGSTPPSSGSDTTPPAVPTGLVAS